MVVTCICFLIADGQGKTTNVPTQSTTQSLQPAAAATIAPVGTLARYRFHWSHAILAVGLLAASGAGTAVLIKVYKLNLSTKVTHFDWYAF